MKKLLFILLLLITETLSASHIVGGEMWYTYVGRSGSNYVYKISMYMYFDCLNAQDGVIKADVSSIDIHVFDNSSNKASYSLSKRGVSGANQTRMSKLNYNCVRNTPNACVDRYYYETTVTLPPNSSGYTITFERCCRNNIINNILRPGKTGATYFTVINDVRAMNNSPYFKDVPPNFLCTNAPLNFDNSAIDPDGDSLSYEIYQPYVGGLDQDDYPKGNGVKPSVFDPFGLAPSRPTSSRLIDWANGYSVVNQIDGNPTLDINEYSGKIILTPTKEGTFVVGIKVKEFRNGVLIGETLRDYQFNVQNCVFDIVAAFFTPTQTCENDLLSLNNRSVNAAEYLWNFGNPTEPNNTSNQKSPSYNYKKPGFYTIKLITKNDQCVDSTSFDIEVKKSFKIVLPKDTLYCGPFTKILSSNLNNKKYLWNTRETTHSININRGGLYWLQAKDGPCMSRDSIFVTNDLSVLDLDPDSVICRDSFVQFTYEGKPNYKTYLWQDGTTFQSVFVSQLGKYNLTVSNENNCFSTDSITFVLYPPPRTYLLDTIICPGTFVTLDALNRNAFTQLETQYLWNTGEKKQIVSVTDTGTYIVKVRNRLCTIYDTAVIDHYFIGLDLEPDTFYCGPVNRTLTTQYEYFTYLWNDEIQTRDLKVTTPGKYKINIVTKEGCLASDSINIYQFASIDAGLGNDTAICLSSIIELKASDSMVSYQWNTGATSQTIKVKDEGLYIVTVKNINDCVISDSIFIKEDPDALPSQMFMPDAFSPNDDAINDWYPSNKYVDPSSYYNLKIFNRWGEKLFESDKPSVQWDGRSKDDIAPQDVYVFVVKYVGCDEKTRTFRGTFHLLR